LFKLCKKNKKKIPIFLEKTKEFLPPKKTRTSTILFFKNLFVALMGLRRIINKPTNFCNTFFLVFFLVGMFWVVVMCLLFFFCGENILFTTCPKLVTKQVWRGRGMNRPNFFPFPQRKKEIKERTVSTWWHRK